MYSAWSVIAGEQPTTSKWNLLGTNDSSFNDGSGLAFTTNNVVPANALATNAITIGYAEVTASQTGISTLTDLTNLTATVTVPQGSRRLMIILHGDFGSGGTANLAAVLIREGSTTLQSKRAPMNVNAGFATAVTVIYSSTAPTPGVHTYKGSLNLVAGGGTVELDADNATSYGAAFIQVLVA